MRKKSITDIQKNFKLSADDRNKIVSSVTARGLKESIKMLEASAKAMEKLTSNLQKTSDRQAGNMEKMLSNHLTVVKELVKKDISLKEWKFSVQRNKSGFISEVTAKQTK